MLYSSASFYAYLVSGIYFTVSVYFKWRKWGIVKNVGMTLQFQRYTHLHTPRYVHLTEISLPDHAYC